MQSLLGIGSRVRHSQHGEGVIINQKTAGYLVTFFETGMRQVKYDEPLEIVEIIEKDADSVSLLDVEMVFSRLLQKWADVAETVPLGDRWKGGKLTMKPGRTDLQAKEMPIEAFFHKIVMMRDRLRCLEQKVNASKGLTDEEKVDMQQYITRCYGSMTSFNVLFKQPEHWFTGDKVAEMA